MKICKDFYDLPSPGSAISVILPPLEPWRHGVNPSFNLLHSKASVSTCHVYQVCTCSAFLHTLFLGPQIFFPHAGFLCLLMGSVHRRFLGRLDLFPCFLCTRCPQGSLSWLLWCKEVRDLSLGSVCGGRSQLWPSLSLTKWWPWLVCLQKASLTLEPLHSQQLFSLLCPVCSFLVWMTDWRAFCYCQFQIQPMNCSYTWTKAISTQRGRNTSPVPPSAVLIGGPFNYSTEGSGSFIPFPRFAFIVKINLMHFFIPPQNFYSSFPLYNFQLFHDGTLSKPKGWKTDISLLCASVTAQLIVSERIASYPLYQCVFVCFFFSREGKRLQSV